MRALPGEASRQPPGPKPPTRKEAAGEQRRRILATAATLFAKRGYHDTTVELIVRRARVGYATFHKNFPDKEACFLDVVDSFSEAAVGRAEQAYAGEQGSWEEKVASAIHAFFLELAEEPAGARVFVVEALTAGPTAVAHYEAALASLEPMLRDGRQHNPRSGELPDTLEGTLAGGVLWIAYQRLIVGEAEQLEAVLPETIEFLLTPYVGEARAVRAANGHSASIKD